jgi:hypothetical protein
LAKCRRSPAQAARDLNNPRAYVRGQDPDPAQGATTARAVLVPLDIQGACQQIHITVHLDVGKQLGKSLMAADDMRPKTSRRLFVKDKASGLQFLVDTGADVCVCPRKLLHGPRRKSDYCNAPLVLGCYYLKPLPQASVS